MEIIGYNIDFNEVIDKVNKNNYKNIVLQLPDGLKTQAKKIVDFLEEKTNAEFIISAESCFGACDLLNIDDLNSLDFDCVVQIGHTSIPDYEKQKIPYLFINALSNIDTIDVLKKTVKYLKGKKVGVLTTSQHLHELDKINNFFLQKNIKAVIGKGDSRIKYPAQILGCNFSSAKKIEDEVDVFLYIGSGMFHPIGLKLFTVKPVISADPYTKLVKIKELEDLKDTILRQRYGAIANCKNAKNFAIIVCSKTGQCRYDLALKLKKMINNSNRNAYICCVDFFSPVFFESFRGFDCFVSTACPRIAIDDYSLYKKPIINPVELEVVLGLREWDNYVFDEIKGLKD